MHKTRSANPALPMLPRELEGLAEISLNLWWTWNPPGKNLFRQVNPFLWKESGHNPIEMLGQMSAEEFDALLKSEHFMNEYRYVYALFRRYMDVESCRIERDILPVAYFCAEFGLHHSLPIYSGGLGFLAGDILKESSDMGLPMIGVGFMYPQGYVRQIIGSDGWQNGANEPIDRDTAPIERVLDKNGEHFTIKVPFIDPPIYAAVWKINIGRVKLYLLDTDIDKNDPWDRLISSRLYTPDKHQRLRQQIVLGIGGYRVLEELGIKYSILHLNEGHPAFALFERVREFMQSDGMSLSEAVQRVRKTSVFTTHTPLQAGTDVYDFNMMSEMFSEYWERLGMSKELFLGYGMNPDDPSSGFNMTVFGMKMCGYRNAVSRKHAKVAADIWKSLFPDTPKKKIPIEYITNGIHIPTWMGDGLRARVDEVLGEGWIDMQQIGDIWRRVEDLDAQEIWKIHYDYKVRLVNFIRERVRKRWSEESIDPMVGMAEGVMLDPDVLTIGFARRMTSYKRPSLILRDLDRLEKIVNDKARPVQIVFAGKAHPADIPGKKILQEIFKVCSDSRFRGRLAFVEDYGEEAAKYLVRGVDVWLNNPTIPMEACGTSGMKASVNGTLHLSVSDGWWDEAYNGKNGWSFGEKVSNDEKDADALYDIIEKEIVPLYYDRGHSSLPMGWIEMMKEAMVSITPAFSARRMMGEYMSKFYIPITECCREEK